MYVHRLAEAWSNAKEGTVIGTLTFTRGSKPNAKPIIKQSFKISVNTTEENDHDHDNHLTLAKDLPLDYTIEAMTKKVPVLHPFTRSGQGTTELHGCVSRTANLQVDRKTSNQYKTYCKNRLLQNVTSNRVVRSLETVDLTVNRGNNIRPPTGGEGFGDSIMKHGRSLLEQNEMRFSNDNSNNNNSMIAGQKRKFEGQSTRSVVFELFEQQRFWTVKELRSVSGRLEKELRPVLGELCEFHRSGEQKGTWSLKKEFQMQEGA